MSKTEIALVLSFAMSFLVSAFICEILKNKKPKYQGYDDKTDTFHCPQCGREISMKLTFLETCPFCKNSY